MLKHFIIKEFVPPDVWDAEGEQSISHIDERLLITADQIWEHFNSIYKGKEKFSITVNDWCYGGKFKYRGYRPPNCTIGAAHSMHRKIDGHKCGAFDCDIKGFTANEARLEIIENRAKFPHLTRMENLVSWLHGDIKVTNKPEIVLFQP
jgi:hypothetical protein